jgi:hypothetical protein
MGRYIWEIISKAWNKSWGKLGFAVNFLLYIIALLAYIIVRRPTLDEVLWGEIMVAVWIFMAVFLFTFVIYITWEMQAVFSNVHLEKRNTRLGAVIVIWNNEPLDLTELSAEILRKTWVTRNAATIRIPVDPDNRSLDLGETTMVSYGGGSKTIRVASGEGGNAMFHTKTLDPDIGYEYYDGADHSTFDIIIQIKGKISGRPIYPKKLRGRLIYIRAEQEFPFSIAGKKQIERNLLSKMEWENLY